MRVVFLLQFNLTSHFLPIVNSWHRDVTSTPSHDGYYTYVRNSVACQTSKHLSRGRPRIPELGFDVPVAAAFLSGVT